MRLGWLGVLVAAAALIPAGTAAAGTYYVATGGDDAGPGTQAKPWKTLQHAAEKVQPGDVVRIAAGEYRGFELETSGKAGAEIAFVGAPGATITSGNARNDGINLEGQEGHRLAYVRIEGLTVTGVKRHGIRAVWCSHVTVRGNKIDRNGYFGIFTGFCDDLLIEKNEVSRSPAEHGIYVSNSGDRPVIRNNHIWDNGRAGIHMNGDAEMKPGDGIISGALVEGNIIHGNGRNGASGINCDGVQASVFRNNLLYDNHASGISIYSEDGGGPSTGNLVVNNTVVMADDGRWALNVQNGSVKNRFVNNILIQPREDRGAFDLCDTCVAGTVSDHNLGIGRFSLDEEHIDLAAWRKKTGQDAHFVETTAAALFTKSPGTTPADFCPRAGSPAIDAGVAAGAPSVDLLGTRRPQGKAVDIGALEAPAATARPRKARLR